MLSSLCGQRLLKKKKRRVWARVDRRCIFIWSDNVSCVKLNALCSCHAHLLRIVKHWELCCIINCWTRFLIKKKVNIDIHCLLKKSIVLVARHTKTYYLCLPTLRWTALEQQGNECNACYCLSQFLFAAFFFFFQVTWEVCAACSHHPFKMYSTSPKSAFACTICPNTAVCQTRISDLWLLIFYFLLEK